ncbi:HAD hydrolase-like protein [Phytohabitans sp. LJ34]|uniref:HAD hydrolase-like protein n=1 Tax=Phytohabitans sp. LJ34 TaxID=3452217 RepID=UPI003F887CC5
MPAVGGPCDPARPDTQQVRRAGNANQGQLPNVTCCYAERLSVLGINLCFAVKRYLEPQRWAQFVREDLDATPNDVWIVGDTSNDLSATHRLGIRGLLVRTGHGSAAERDHTPRDAVVNDVLDAALHIIESARRTGPQTQGGQHANCVGKQVNA